jgi:hypothetical protein
MMMYFQKYLTRADLQKDLVVLDLVEAKLLRINSIEVVHLNPFTV